jgi:hypothetical protein
MKNAGWARSG